MKFNKSIRGRLTISYLIIIFITMVFTDVAIATVLRNYLYNNVRVGVESQLAISADMYERYFSDETLENNVAQDVDAFWRGVAARVQIVDREGRVLLDSFGNRPVEPLRSADVVAALSGGITHEIYLDPVTEERVMAVSHALISGGDIVGALRFITSLRGADASLRVLILNFIVFGLGILAVSFFVSVVLGRRIIRPVVQLTRTAEIMAKGNFSVRSVKIHEDEVGKLSDTLNYMASEIKKKDALKNEFISSVSHELRTPLTSIKGWSVTLMDPDTDPVLLKEGLDIISEESDRLRRLVEELLDFSKFVSGKVALEAESVDVARLFDFLRNHMKKRAERENKVLLVEAREDMGMVHADPNRLKQVFINLLDNAFKFTPVGGTIRMTFQRQRGYAEFVVEDNGSGIMAEDLDKVKEKFFKGKSSNASSGIGLSICDEIALLHGGELVIESIPGEGTRVLFRLPLKGGAH